jgi:hypothetical protein
MTELGGQAGGADDRGVDHFIVDGVAPPVIGATAHDDQTHDDQTHHDQTPDYQDPPTAPIPTAAQPQEPRKSWLAKMFRRP